MTMDPGMPPLLLHDLQFFRDLLFEYRLFVPTLVAASLYTSATYWYWWMWRKAGRHHLLGTDLRKRRYLGEVRGA